MYRQVMDGNELCRLLKEVRTCWETHDQSAMVSTVSPLHSFVIIDYAKTFFPSLLQEPVRSASSTVTGKMVDAPRSTYYKS